VWKKSFFKDKEERRRNGYCLQTQGKGKEKEKREEIAARGNTTQDHHETCIEKKKAFAGARARSFRP